MISTLERVAPLREPRLDPHFPEHGMARRRNHGSLERPDQRHVRAARREGFAVQKRMKLGLEPYHHSPDAAEELPVKETGGAVEVPNMDAGGRGGHQGPRSHTARLLDLSDDLGGILHALRARGD